MKRALLMYVAGFLTAGFVACETTETFDSKGRVTSRVVKPSPTMWTAIDNAVRIAGESVVKSWVDQMADQQRWERGEK